MTRYHQLTLEQRYQIAALRSMKMTNVDIAATVGVHRSTVYRELRRNGRVVGKTSLYNAQAAHRRAHQRRIAKGERQRKIQGPLRDLVESKLRLGWSPEQICGRLRLERGQTLSHETVYQHVLRDARQQGTLRYCLRHAGYGYKRFRKSRHIRAPVPTIRTIHDRPDEADQRTELGHWERDLVVSAQNSSSLLTIVDRKSRYTLVRWVSRPTAAIVNEQTTAALAPFTSLNRSLTNDNGTEFKNPSAVEASLHIPVYFTDPGAPWQRGTVENTAGLTRQYYPKRTGGIPDEYAWSAQAIEQTLNVRPRRTLGYRTPHEVFFDQQLRLLSGPLSRVGLEISGSS